jgi:STAM-binding protein
LLRYSTLVLDNLPGHPEAKDPESKKAMKPLMKRMPMVIEQLEDLKPQLNESYEEYLKIKAAQRNRQPGRQEGLRSFRDRHAEEDPALSWNRFSQPKVLDAAKNRELAVDLARTEIRRRRRQATVPEEEEHRRRGAGIWEDWDADGRGPSSRSTYDNGFGDDQELRRQMEATRRQLDRSHQQDVQNEGFSSITPASSGSWAYPTIAKSTPYQYDSATRVRREAPGIRPPRPPKEAFARQSRPFSMIDVPPPLPDKEPFRAPSPPRPVSRDRDVPPSLPPKLSAPTQEKRITFKPAGYLENGKPLRTVFLPSKLRPTFLKLAEENTRRGLEMCGMLCGTPVNNALFITCLLIPEQKCTSDTCETENESGMLDFCMTNELIIIGWIHTHPTQTCFMSSRDLHTQAGYQVMMPESIAIVCAPRYDPS